MDAISRDWASRAALPQHVVQMVNNFPSTLHPMSQFSAGITAMQAESKFAKAYSEGIPKTQYWEVRRWEGVERERECESKFHTTHTHTLSILHTYTHFSLQYAYEDSMDLIAKLPTLASVIYRNLYRDGKVGAIDPGKDWSANFASMLGYEGKDFTGKAEWLV